MEMTALREAIEGWQTSATTALEKNTKDIDELRTALDKVELRLNRPGTGGQDRAPAGSLETKAWGNYLRRGREGMDDLMEVKSLIVGDDTRGGYLAPPQFVADVLKGIVQFSPVRQAAKVGVTSAGSVILPQRIGTPTAVWVGETEDRSETGSTYGQVEIRIDEAACYVDISQRLLEDAAVDVGAEVAADLSQEFGRLEGASFVSGNGVAKPLGFMASAAGLGFVANGHSSAPCRRMASSTWSTRRRPTTATAAVSS